MVRRPLALLFVPLSLGALACFSDPLPEDTATSNAEAPETGADDPTTTDDGSSEDDPTTDTDDPTESESETETGDDDPTDPTDGGCPDPVCFDEAFELGAGFGPEDVVVADIDGDGERDLVTANGGGDNVAVLRGLGDGDFMAPSFYAAGTEPVAVAAVNLDPEAPDDAGLDLVVGNRAGEAMTILINTGNAVAFGAPDIIELGVGLVDLDVGNLTLDSDYESVVGAIGEQGILITHGNGTGIAGDLDAAPTADPAVAVTAGFLTQDPYSDFISVSNLGPSLTVVHFLGEEPYLDVFDLVIADAAEDLILASLDADPHLDLVVVSADLGILTVFPGDGNGMFLAPEPIALDVGADSLAVGDVDDDGNVDVVFAASTADEVGIMLGNGDTTLAAPLIYDVGMRPLAVALFDFDGDGILDIVTANADGDNVSILLSDAP